MTDRPPRVLALIALRNWRKGGGFADTIVHRLLGSSTLAAPDRAFTTELVFGVLRNLRLLDYWISLLRDGSVDADSRDTLRLGLYQLLLLNSAEHAAVFETVAAAKPHARGLVNAILRAAQTRRLELLKSAEETPLAIRCSHPAFLIERWQKHFGETETAELCAWNNRPPDTFARTNQIKISPAQFFDNCPGASPLSAYPTVTRVSEFPAHELELGHCYIQDPSTMLACTLLDPQPGESVLDTCAAPGGKTAYIAELMKNRGRVLATDRDSRRLDAVRENLQRLGVGIVETQPHDWAAGGTEPREMFDRILVDAPCSNTGVMRRRVDVRWRLTATDFARMQREQIAIVTHVLPWLKPGGVFVYSTCSLEPEENEDVVRYLQLTIPALRLDQQKSSLPFRDGIDGAFAARFIAVDVRKFEGEERAQGTCSK